MYAILFSMALFMDKAAAVTQRGDEQTGPATRGINGDFWSSGSAGKIISNFFVVSHYVYLAYECLSENYISSS